MARVSRQSARARGNPRRAGADSRRGRCPRGAIGAALQDAGAAVVFCNRSAARAESLAAALDAGVLPWEHRADALADYALLVNATSLGMSGQPELKMPLARAGAKMVVADIVYAPLETPLLAAARGARFNRGGGVGDAAAPGGGGFCCMVWDDAGGG